MSVIRLMSWNVNGIRANIKKGFWDNVATLRPHILGIQETKSDATIMESGVLSHPEYAMHYHSATIKKGYSGVATLSLVGDPTKDKQLFSQSRPAPESVDLQIQGVSYGVGDAEFDQEGRLVITHYTASVAGKEVLEFSLLNGYHPQGGRGPHRVEYKIAFYARVLQIALDLRAQGKKVILCGDFNTTVTDIDLARPKENRNTTGCLPEERAALNTFFTAGFIDTFRHFYPDQAQAYTYWDQITRARERNVGWRIDYVLVDQSLLPFLQDAYICPQILGSDHCPVGIDLKIPAQ